MAERNNPTTSNDAFRALTPESLAKDYKSIIDALKVLKLANYEVISRHIGWVDINKCSRRLLELQNMQIIYKPGSKSNTSRNRQAFNYSLVENNEQKSAEPEKVMQGKTVSDYSKEFVQKSLF